MAFCFLFLRLILFSLSCCCFFSGDYSRCVVAVDVNVFTYWLCIDAHVVVWCIGMCASVCVRVSWSMIHYSSIRYIAERGKAGEHVQTCCCMVYCVLFHSIHFWFHFDFQFGFSWKHINCVMLKSCCSYHDIIAIWMYAFCILFLTS